jgi:two-component system, NtrC family, response regulator
MPSAVSESRGDPASLSSMQLLSVSTRPHDHPSQQGADRYGAPTHVREKILLVEADQAIQAQIRWAIGPSYDVAAASDRAAAILSFRDARPLVVVLDLGLPPSPGESAEGFATLSALLSIEPLTKVAVVVGENEEHVARQAIGLGAFDSVTKPINPEQLRMVLARCFHIAQLEREHRELKLRFQSDSFEGLLGTCPAMLAVFEAIRKVATTDAPVLISGESGTGKEMTALAIHHHSARKDGPFVSLSCSAIPNSLLESELFGHERSGGIAGPQAGRIELARGGTLFLDEVAQLSEASQVKLLRFLQDQTFERVSGRQPVIADTRVLAATNLDLTGMITTGAFRDDLFYRLAVVQIHLPPLRERGDDVELLARAFLHDYSERHRKPDLVFGSDALQAIRHHNWPGNVRELQNRIQRAVIMGDGNRISAPDLELTATESTSEIEIGSLREARARLERQMIQKALRKHTGNISAAAAELGISRPTFYQLLQKLGIEKEHGHESDVA